MGYRVTLKSLYWAGSLKILKEIVVHPDIRKAITQMGGIELMVYQLDCTKRCMTLLCTLQHTLSG